VGVFVGAGLISVPISSTQPAPCSASHSLQGQRRLGFGLIAWPRSDGDLGSEAVAVVAEAGVALRPSVGGQSGRAGIRRFRTRSLIAGSSGRRANKALAEGSLDWRLYARSRRC